MCFHVACILMQIEYLDKQFVETALSEFQTSPQGDVNYEHE